MSDARLLYLEVNLQTKTV